MKQSVAGHMTAVPDAPGVSGIPRLVLRLEGAALLLLSCVAYGRTGSGWWLFAVLFLAPDLSFLGYLAGPRAGALIYNAVHTTLAPIILGCTGYVLAWPTALALAFIWAAHVGFDRALGYGLKYGAGFGFTHLGWIGRAAEPGAP
jgi:hypothetical protein